MIEVDPICRASLGSMAIGTLHPTKAAGRVLQGRIGDEERCSFRDTGLEEQDICRRSADNTYCCYRCIRLYDNDDWLAALLVGNGGIDSPLLCSSGLPEKRLSD
jgi:hypothetical protein